jgi:hypothetical protein
MLCYYCDMETMTDLVWMRFLSSQTTKIEENSRRVGLGFEFIPRILRQRQLRTFGGVPSVSEEQKRSSRGSCSCSCEP